MHSNAAFTASTEAPESVAPESMTHESPPAPAAQTPFEARRVSESELCGALLAEWEALHASLTPRTPFTSPLWNLLWWQHYRSDRLSVRDELFIYVVRDARSSLVAVAPMMSTERPSVGPVRARTLQCFGADPNVTEIRGIVCAPENEGEALRTLRTQIEAEQETWDWIDWGAVRRDRSDEIARRAAQGACMQGHDLDNYYLELPASWGEFRTSRSRNIKESIRKCYNSLKRDGHTPELHVVQTPEEMGAALLKFFELHSRRSLLDKGVTHSDVFRRDHDRAFLCEFVMQMAMRNQARIFQLRIGGEVVATRIGFRLGDEVYLYYSGYDPAWGRYSVMTTLVVEAIKWSIEQRFRIVNLSTGTDVSKLRWSPASVGYRALTEILPGWRSNLSFNAFHKVRELARSPQMGRLTALLRR